MLEGIFTSLIKEKLLFYILKNTSAYPRELAKNLDLTLSHVQQQLEQAENGGVLVSHLRGKIRLFELNKRYPFNKELIALLEKAFTFLPEKEQELYVKRRRPRKPSKPL
jgi:hypothetical protein